MRPRHRLFRPLMPALKIVNASTKNPANHTRFAVRKPKLRAGGAAPLAVPCANENQGGFRAASHGSMCGQLPPKIRVLGGLSTLEKPCRPPPCRRCARDRASVWAGRRPARCARGSTPTQKVQNTHNRPGSGWVWHRAGRRGRPSAGAGAARPLTASRFLRGERYGTSLRTIACRTQ